MSVADDDNSSVDNHTVFEMTKRGVVMNIQRRYPELSDANEIILVGNLYEEDGPLGTRNLNCQ